MPTVVRARLNTVARTAVYLALGWVAVLAMPQLFARLGMTGGLLIVAGGLVYSAGQPCMACAAPSRPRPSSATTRSSTCW
jgi:channel protein (hemolysin III family)